MVRITEDPILQFPRRRVVDDRKDQMTFRRANSALLALHTCSNCYLTLHRHPAYPTGRSCANMRGGRLEGFPDGVPIPNIAKPDKYCILADLLIPGKGDPIENGCLVVEGSRITFAGKESDLEIQDAKLPKTHVKVCLQRRASIRLGSRFLSRC